MRDKRDILVDDYKMNIINFWSHGQELSEVDRSSLLDDAFNLARVTQLDYATALSLTQYLDSEESYVPWRSMGR